MDKKSKPLVDFLDDEPKSLAEYWQILKRRRYLFLLPAVAIALIALFLALSLPANYRSVATILIEDQEIQEDLIGATVSSYASRQIQLISQRLLTGKNIQEIVEKLDVYGPTDSDNPPSLTAIAARFRNDLELELVNAEELESQRRSGEPAIAFTLAFNSEDPEIAQAVTAELATLFLGENQRSSALRTSGVSQLLRNAVEGANEELLTTEAELADFKARHEGALPELHELNLGVVNRSEQQLADVSSRIQQLQQRKLQLSAQLAQLSPSAPVTLPSGETVMSDRDRLRALLIDYRRKTAIYQEGHPDIVRLEREIDSLRQSVGDADTYPVVQEQLRQERERLAALRERYSADHPDIRSSQAAADALQSQLASMNPRSGPEEVVADNPAYVMIHTQLQAADLEMAGLLQKRAELEATIAQHETLIKQAPQVEMQYESVLRRYENAKAKHSDLQSRLRAAEVAANVGQEISGQRFTLIEPAALPLNPESPDRPSIMLIGILLAVVAGVGCVAVIEVLDNSIRSTKKLAEIAGAPPLAVIPYLSNSVDDAQMRKQRFLVTSSLFIVGIVCVVYAVFVV
jgi:uncharacterized protein involved in exopolysaccharide biosynthesis